MIIDLLYTPIKPFLGTANPIYIGPFKGQKPPKRLFHDISEGLVLFFVKPKKFIHLNFGDVTCLTIFLITSVDELAGDGYEGSFFENLFNVFCLVSPDCDVVPLGICNFFTFVIGKGFIGSNCKCCELFTAVEGSYFRIISKISDDRCTVFLKCS